MLDGMRNYCCGYDAPNGSYKIRYIEQREKEIDGERVCVCEWERERERERSRVTCDYDEGWEI